MQNLTYRKIALLLICVTATRLPLLWTGYGSDADAWMVANAADRLWHTGEYNVSRFPGYPLHEIISAPFVALGGPVLSNGVTLLASIVLLLVWFRIAARHFHHAELLLLTLAFTPLFWIQSAATTDYVWSLLFLALSLDSALQNRVILCGLWLGLAAGFRLSNLVASVPLAAFLFYKERSPGRILSFLAPAFIVMLLAYSPLLITYGPIGWIHLTRNEMSDIHFTWTERVLFFGYRSIYALGPLAVLSCFAILLTHLQELKRRWKEREPVLVTSCVGGAMFLLLFFVLPLERAYLLPALLFLLMAVATVATRTQLIVFALCIASFGLLNPDIIKHQGMRGTAELNVHWGVVVEELQRRDQLMKDRVRIANIRVAGKTMIMTGGGAAFWFQNEHVEHDTSWQWRELKERVVRKRSDPDIHFVALLTRAELERIRWLGYTVYCLGSAREFIEKTTGVSMAQEQVIVLQH